MQAVPLVFSKPPKNLPVRGICTRSKIKCKCTHEKRDSKEYKTNLGFRKVKCEANHRRNWAKSTKYASCISSR